MTWGLLRIDLNIIKIPWWSTIYYDYLHPSFIHSMFIKLPCLLHLNPKTWGLAYFELKQSKSTFFSIHVSQIFSADARKYRNSNCGLVLPLVSTIDFWPTNHGFKSRPSHIFSLFFPLKCDKKWVLASPNFGECNARVKLKLADSLNSKIYFLKCR